MVLFNTTLKILKTYCQAMIYQIQSEFLHQQQAYISCLGLLPPGPKMAVGTYRASAHFKMEA